MPIYLIIVLLVVKIYKKFKNLILNLKCIPIFYGGDFYERIKDIPDNSIDLIIDGCSITHFCGPSTIHNSGINSWTKFKNICDLKLKQNGYCVISTDVKYDENTDKTGSNGEYVYPMDIINIFSNDYEISNPILSNQTLTDDPTKRILCCCFKKKNNNII